MRGSHLYQDLLWLYAAVSVLYSIYYIMKCCFYYGFLVETSIQINYVKSKIVNY